MSEPGGAPRSAPIGGRGRLPGRRAPRLGPSERIARHVTRRGRFRRIDPLKPRALPRAARVIAALGWAALLAESLRRAYRTVRSAEGATADR